MTRTELNEYVNLHTTIDQKCTEFDESIASLKDEIKKKTDEYNDSVRELYAKCDICSNKIKEEGKKIIRKIEKILDKSFCFYNNFPAAEDAFGIIVTNNSSNSDDSDESYSSSYNILLFSKYTKLINIKEITDDCVIFNAETDLSEGDYAFGTIGIPIRYFETDVLDDKQFITEMLEKTKQNELEIRKKKKLDEIANLEAEIDKIKAELNTLGN